MADRKPDGQNPGDVVEKIVLTGAGKEAERVEVVLASTSERLGPLYYVEHLSGEGLLDRHTADRDNVVYRIKNAVLDAIEARWS